MFYCKVKKIISGLLIGLGCGLVFVTILPPKVWIILLGIGIVCIGISILTKK